MKNASLRKIIFAALMAALTTVATMIIRIPTPTQGYIHLGDGMVLLCGAQENPLAEQQLRKASYRLAAALNRIFGE